MGNRTTTIIYWADTDLAFVKLAKDLSVNQKSRHKFVRWSHHPSWFTNKKNYFLNALHIAKLFFESISASANANVVIFGTNACRMLFWFSAISKKTIFVYNEIPHQDQNWQLELIDKIICRNSKNLYVSSEERAHHMYARFELTKIPKVLLNSPIVNWLNIEETSKKTAFVYAGGITKKRFTIEAISKLIKIGIPVHVFGMVQGDLLKDLQEPFIYCGHLSQDKMLRELQNYKYGLISYYRNEINYELCAPIKIYEYVAAGCIIVSVEKNKGLEKYFMQFPNLFFTLEKFNQDGHANATQLSQERNKFLEIALNSNKALVSDLFV